jgi:hypothetical protein
MATAPEPTPAEAAALRAEHDALAKRLDARVSIEAVRRGAYQMFAGLIGVGTSFALAWDRWGTLKPGVVRKVKGPPVFLYLAMAGTVVLLVLAIRSFLHARTLMREEDALYERFRALRAALRIDP